jgi:hypothetical protein
MGFGGGGGTRGKHAAENRLERLYSHDGKKPLLGQQCLYFVEHTYTYTLADNMEYRKSSHHIIIMVS